jgi:hypothetical protein
VVRFACFRLGIAPLKLSLRENTCLNGASENQPHANCPRISGIPVPELLKSLSTSYRKRCPGISETRKEITADYNDIIYAATCKEIKT